MAKNIPLGGKNHSGSEHSAPKGGKVIDMTKKEVIDNLEAAKKLKQAEAALEKEKAKIEQIEEDVEGVEREVEQQIKEKKAQLIEMPAPAKKAEHKEEKSSPKKEKKWDLNPLNWMRHIGTRALSGVVGLPSRTMAKLKHIGARPQQLVSKQFYKDLWTNLLRTPKAILTTISGAVYKPHRDIAKFEDNFKDYGPEFANPTDKNAIVRNGKKALWYAGKVALPLGGGVFSLLPKFFANIGRGMNHAIHETFEGIRDSKWHWNPKKWNLKPWKFSKTQEAFGKAFSWNKKGKSIDVKHLADKEHKKAA